MSVQSAAIPVLRRERSFYVGMAIAAILTVFAGFAPTYYFKSFAGTPPLPLVIHVHAIVNTAWILFFFAQATLVASGRVVVHRRLGLMGGVLATLVVVLGAMTAVHGARGGYNPAPPGAFPDSLAFMMVGLRDITVFAAFVTAGFCFRRHSQLHKRLMLLGTIGGLMWPAITRLPYVGGRLLPMLGLMGGLAMAPAARELLVHRRVHAVSFWGGLLILGSIPLCAAIAGTGAWHSFAAWLIH